jgi:hypothetical protein
LDSGGEPEESNECSKECEVMHHNYGFDSGKKVGRKRIRRQWDMVG